MVLVYEPEWTATCQGGATEFDTGGLHGGWIKANNMGTAADRLQYFQAHNVRLRVWRAEFVSYVNRHLASPAAYVRGESPTSDDASGRLLHPGNARRAWTWEVRVQRDHPAFNDTISIYVTPDYFEDLRREVRALANPARARWLGWLGTIFIKHSYANSGVALHARAEADVAGAV